MEGCAFRGRGAGGFPNAWANHEVHVVWHKGSEEGIWGPQCAKPLKLASQAYPRGGDLLCLSRGATLGKRGMAGRKRPAWGCREAAQMGTWPARACLDGGVETRAN